MGPMEYVATLTWSWETERTKGSQNFNLYALSSAQSWVKQTIYYILINLSVVLFCPYMYGTNNS